MSNEDIFQLGVKALIQNEEGKLLLLKIPPKMIGGTLKEYWDLPGGRMQHNESLEDTLRREVYEEAGLEQLGQMVPFCMALSKIRIPSPVGSTGLIFAIFLCPPLAHPAIRLSDEHESFEWLYPQQAAELLRENFPLELVEKIVSLPFSYEAVD